VVVNVFALLVSTLLYLKGKLGISVLGEPVDRHSHGSFGLDFWVGRELNPHIGSYDIKFNAYRVGMLFWLVLNLSFLAKQLQEHGTTTLRMLSFQFMTGFYVLDYFWNEPKMLTTWDIINEEFGHMLVFGDYVFIPFVFCFQCLFLTDLPEFKYPLIECGVILVLFAVGYHIFRTANSQKNSFKVDPNAPINGKKPETFEGKLLISGYWGLGRHMNYTGDLIMAFAYCLTCGFSSLLPYFYFIYLTTLLLHRAYRDDAKCQQKYGGLWTRYCERVPYVFIPCKLDLILQNAGKALYHLTNPEDK
jgi:delta14-sterol reductase